MLMTSSLAAHPPRGAVRGTVASARGEQRSQCACGSRCDVSVFFFSSRRRHTRCLSDWSSDVCSSDLSTEAGAKRRLDDMTFGPGPYPLGAAWEAALVSSDRAVRIFAKTVPYPITAADGPCKVSLELSSHVGDRFVASGKGFPPGEDVLTQLRYSGRLIQKQNRISPAGLLWPDPTWRRSTMARRDGWTARMLSDQGSSGLGR